MRGRWEIAVMGGTVRLRFRLRQAVAFLGLGLAMVMAGVSRGEEPAAKDWIGKRVVQKYNNFPVRVDGQPVPGSGERFLIYRVERVEGDRLWLKAEGEGIRGWAAIGQVIPIDQAIAFFNDRISAHPDDAFPHFMRAGLWMDQNELDRAVEDCTEIIQLEPGARSFVDRGNLWLRMHNADKAIADFDQAIRLDPQATPAFTGRGDARQMKKEYDQAIADHSEAIRLSPDDPIARYSRGQSLGGDGRPRQGHRRLHRSPQARSGMHRRPEWPGPCLAQEDGVRQGDRRLQHGLEARPQERGGLLQPRSRLAIQERVHQGG